MVRIQDSHIFLSHRFHSLAPGPLRGERQGVLQSLRWDPIEGRQIHITKETPDTDGLVHRNHGRWQPGEQTWEMSYDLAVAEWLGSRSSEPGYFLELASYVPLESFPPVQTQALLPKIAAYKQRGSRGLFAGAQQFFWSVSYHFAHPGRIALEDEPAEAEQWHAEGGRYYRDFSIYGPDLWYPRLSGGQARLASNARFGDNFDPKAAYRFEGIGSPSGERPTNESSYGFALAPQGPTLPLRPFVVRLGRLLPEAPLCEPRVPACHPTAGNNKPLSAWLKPTAGELVMSWAVSPPLRFTASARSWE